MDEDIAKALLGALAAASIGSNTGKTKFKLSKYQQMERLKEAYEDWLAPATPFKPGDLIQAKSEAFTAWQTAHTDRILVVTEVLAEPRYTEDKDEGSAYAHMRYDICAMSVNERGLVPQHYYDSRYFKLYDAAAEEENTNIAKFTRRT